MRWDAVAQAFVADLEADGELVTELGLDDDGEVPIYPASGSRPIRIPSVEWLLIYNREIEEFEPTGVQFDYWAKGPRSAVTIERRIRAVLHSDTRRLFAGSDCETTYQDSRDHQYPDPGVLHRSLDFRFVPVRELYL